MHLFCLDEDTRYNIEFSLSHSELVLKRSWSVVASANMDTSDQLVCGCAELGPHRATL